MNEHRHGKPRWAIALFVILMASVVGFVAFRMGVTHGVALGVATAAPNESVEAGRHVVGPYLHDYPWHGPWGFGPFGFVFPFLFLGLMFMTVRLLLWGGPRGGPWGRRGWDGPYDFHDRPRDVPRRFEEWHRRAHERMKDGDTHDHHDDGPPRPPNA